MRELVGELPSQLRWAAGIDVASAPPASDVIVAGMGGSGIAGDAGVLVAEGEHSRVAVHKSYGLPGWADGSQLVLVVSHSGNTEEALTAVDAAVVGGHRWVAVTTGGELARRGVSDGVPVVTVPPGPQPRAAFGFLAGAVLRVLESVGAVGPQAAGLGEAAEVVESLLAGEAPALAARIAEGLAGRMTVVYGATGVTGVAALRWKTQLNENAKAPAAWEVLPEADHNDIVGWGAYPDLTSQALATVFLSDSQDHPRIAARRRITREIIADAVPVVAEVASRGTSTIARLFSLVVIGDLVSVAVAERSGVDPMPVHVIEDLKSRLTQESS